MVGEVQVVPAERLLDPLGDPDERWAVDVRAHPIVHVGPDDRLGGEPYGADRAHVTPRSCECISTGGDRAPGRHRLRIPMTLPLSAGAGRAACVRPTAANTSSRSGGKGVERPVAVSTCMHMSSFVAARYPSAS